MEISITRKEPVGKRRLLLSADGPTLRKAREISRLVRPNMVSQRAKESKSRARRTKASHL
uniref:Uncharacterized protein n=1 Tax=Cucumis melo TaxID=3656 RepID=A0A9I9DN17_CUCME